MRKHTTYSRDKVLAADVVDLYVNQKMSASKIAARINCSSLTILNILRSRGIEIRRRGTYAQKIMPEMIEQIIQEYESGESLSIIASRNGVNHNTIYYHLLKRKVKTRSNSKLLERDVRKVHEEYKKMPTKETMERMARELGVTVNAIRYQVGKLKGEGMV